MEYMYLILMFYRDFVSSFLLVLTLSAVKSKRNGRLLVIWATSRENVSSVISDQVKFKPACSATEAS